MRSVARRLVIVWVVALSSAGMIACVGDRASEARPFDVSSEAGWFVQTGCTGCHSISVYGVSNLAVRAPDLSLAVEDVPKRFGRSLEDFLRAPTGTMAMVLTSRIVLSEDDRRRAIEELNRAYLRYRQTQDGPKPVPSH